MHIFIIQANKSFQYLIKRSKSSGFLILLTDKRHFGPVHDATAKVIPRTMSSPYLAKDLESSTFTVHAPREALPLNLAPVVKPPEQINVESKGVYHGLPTYGQEFHGKSALIAGANGISGAYMLKVMTDYVCNVSKLSDPVA